MLWQSYKIILELKSENFLGFKIFFINISLFKKKEFAGRTNCQTVEGILDLYCPCTQRSQCSEIFGDDGGPSEYTSILRVQFLSLA